jgi:molybdenum cofactor cytidylyltransferase
MDKEAADCIILAAGLSTRMGRWKMILPYGDATVIETAVAGALAAADRVILVTGYRGEELEEKFTGFPRVTTVRNYRYEEGMFSSVRTGVTVVGEGRFFVLPGDMPGVELETYTRLLEAPKAPVVVPEFQGKTGHPVLLDSRVRGAVLEASAGSNLKEVLAGFRRLRVSVEDGEILHDLDTAEDYRDRAV